MEHRKPILEAADLTKSYGAQQAINGVTLKLDRPGVYAILGQNGAGKTSLIKCALGLEPITSGSINVMGHKPGAIKAKQRTGVILQDSGLPDLLTVREHIALFASYYPAPFSVEQTISLCDLSAFADKRYKKLSGGQKRRAQFALAIVGDPDLIFLDEPTTGLDIEARKNLWTVIRHFAQKGKTIVLTTHYLEEADNLADRITVLNQGKVVADAKPREIHQRFSGSTIRCQTKLSVEQVASLPHINSADTKGRFVEAHSSFPNKSLIAWLQQDPELTDLAVNQPKLEDIFSQLSHTGDAP